MTTTQLNKMKLSELIKEKEFQLKQIIKLSEQITNTSKQDLTKQYTNIYRVNHNSRLINERINYIAKIDNAIQYICEA